MLDALEILPLELHEIVVNEVVICPSCRQFRAAHDVVHEVIVADRSVLICHHCYALVTTLIEDDHQTEEGHAV